MIDFISIRENRTYFLAFAVLISLQLCPIWFTPYPAMHDYPNHLARSFILHAYNDSTSYQATYERDGRILPNLAMDLIVPNLMFGMSIETSSRVFLSLIILAFGIGVHLLGSAVQAPANWSALAATFFTYNFTMSYGFANYMFGVGLFFITVATWIRFECRWTPFNLLLISALAMGCFISHLSAFVFLAISLLCLTGLQVIKARSFQVAHGVGLLPLIGPTVAYIYYTIGIDYRLPMEWWHPLIIKKLTGLLYPFLSYHLIFDLCLATAFMLLMFIGMRKKTVSIVSWELLMVGGLFLILYVVSPMNGGIQSSYIDRRFLLPAAVFLLLAVRFDVAKTAASYVLIGLLSVCVLRTGEVWYHWNRIGHEVRKQVQIMSHLPDGARLYPMIVHDPSPTGEWLWDMHFFFTAHYATIYRNSFVPTIYAWKNVHPIYLRSTETGFMQVERTTPIEHVNWQNIFLKYDFLWGYKLSEEFERFLLGRGRLVAKSGDTVLINLQP
ncbi:MAG: hypothetical protein P0111_06460 [Nitrospira sp.]|nr:hypothetical protein [Nitrospira sp.]